MKIKYLKLKNFAQFTDFECEYNDEITHLVGVNGSGKTTVGINALWICLKGIAEKSKDGQLVGERFRFIGTRGATANIEIKLIDEKRNNAEIIVTNKISSSGNQIKFKAPAGYELDLNNILSVALLSAKNFTQLSAREQALLLGIDTSQYDKEIKSLKEEFTFINRDLKAIGEINFVKEVQSVSVNDLIKQRDDISNFNEQQKAKQTLIDNTKNQLDKIAINIGELERQLSELREKKEKGLEYLQSLPVPEPLQDNLDVSTQLFNAEETNRKAAEYKSYLEKLNRKNEKETELQNNKDKQEFKFLGRLEFIKSFQFGFEGLSVDDDGGLLLDDRPIKEPYFSKGELEIIVAKLYASLNPELKIRFIDEFQSLDEDNQAKIVDELLAQGFQIITAEVGKKATKDNTILLKECKEVKEY